MAALAVMACMSCASAFIQSNGKILGRLLPVSIYIRSPRFRPPFHQKKDRVRRRLTVLHQRQTGIEVGIQTAQLLMDPKRHDKLHQQLSRQFPLVPKPFLDACIDLVADAFMTVAPNKLKQALRPGGMEKVRPEIQRGITGVVLEQPMVRAIPVLNSKDKANLIESIVDMALDYVLQDAETVLAAPEVRLEALEEEIREVKRLMGPWRVLLYRIRHIPLAMIVTALTAALFVLVYQQEGRIDLTAFSSVGHAVYSKVSPILAVIGTQALRVFQFVARKLSLAFSFVKAKLSNI